jgi:hypothetical protein
MDKEKLNVDEFGAKQKIPLYDIKACRYLDGTSVIQTEIIARDVEKEFLIPLMSAAISAGWFSCKYIKLIVM